MRIYATINNEEIFGALNFELKNFYGFNFENTSEPVFIFKGKYKNKEEVIYITFSNLIKIRKRYIENKISTNIIDNGLNCYKHYLDKKK